LTTTAMWQHSTSRPKPIAYVCIIATGWLRRVGKTMVFGKVLGIGSDGRWDDYNEALSVLVLVTDAPQG